ncbi:MAG: sulfurtransferase TusA family protein [Nocardioides sp.]
MTAESEDPPIAAELDCRGLRCPVPVIELGRRFTEVAVGELIGVVTEDIAARTDIPAWCRMRGQEYAGESLTDDQVPRYLVRRTS